MFYLQIFSVHRHLLTHHSLTERNWWVCLEVSLVHQSVARQIYVTLFLDISFTLGISKCRVMILTTLGTDSYFYREVGWAITRGLNFFSTQGCARLFCVFVWAKACGWIFFKVKHRTWLVERTCSSVFFCFFFSYMAPLTRFFWRRGFAVQNFFLEIGPPQKKKKNGPSIICMIMSRCF